jgi:anti-anti-sigma factor
LFSVEHQGATLIIAPMLSSGTFRFMQLQIETNALRKRLQDWNVRRLVIDLHTLDYFGAELFRVIVSLARQTEGAGGQVVLCCTSPGMNQSLANLGFDRLWRFYQTREEAVTAVNG